MVNETLTRAGVDQMMEELKNEVAALKADISALKTGKADIKNSVSGMDWTQANQVHNFYTSGSTFRFAWKLEESGKYYIYIFVDQSLVAKIRGFYTYE